MPETQIPQIRPQEGFQEQFLSSSADIVIGGSGAGVGKSFALLMEAARHSHRRGFTGIVFRRTYKEINAGGGLFDTSQTIYPALNGKATQNKWVFPSGAKIEFSHLQHEKDVYSHQGVQYAFIGFDELTHFSRKMVFYLLTRNRSTCGIRPYMRATCNPDPDSWVADFIEWYIEQDESSPNYGLPIPDRVGILRYFTIDDGKVVWGNSLEEVRDRALHIFDDPAMADVPLSERILSFTFIPGKIRDNKILMQKDPGYLAKLTSQDSATRSQLLDGNWKISSDGLSLCDHKAVNRIFTNFAGTDDAKDWRITVDVAGFGKDLAVVSVFKGWDWRAIHILTNCTPDQLDQLILQQRQKYSVSEGKVLPDGDGMGWGLSSNQYVFFHGGAPALDERPNMAEVSSFEVAQKYSEQKKFVDYKNLRTQCWYHLAEKIINKDKLCMRLEEMIITVDGMETDEIPVKNKTIDIRRLIKEELRAVKRRNPDKETKKQISTKEELKEVLGRSPDISDTLMMNAYFDLDPAPYFSAFDSL